MSAVIATKDSGLQLLGISHRTAPIEELEKLSLSGEEIEKLVAAVRATGKVDDMMVLSTCNRTEIYGVAHSSTDLIPIIQEKLKDVLGKERVPAQDLFYENRGRPSLEHLFGVSCGLDSMILGEAQILGQIKSSIEAATRRKEPEAYLEHIWQAALRVGRKSRAETEIGRGAVSVASAAVHLSARIYSDFSDLTVLLVGAGDTGRLAAEHFAKHHPGKLLVINRTFERAEKLALALNGEAHPFDSLPEMLERADVVTCAVKVEEPLITRKMVADAMKKRRSKKSLVILDLGLPRNVAADVNKVRNVFVNDITDLKHVVDGSLSRRRKEVPKVEGLIQGEIARLQNSADQAQIGPFIAELRRSVDALRQQEVERVTNGLSDKERAAVEQATRAVVNKILHAPTMVLKNAANDPAQVQNKLQAVREVFGLDNGE